MSIPPICIACETGDTEAVCNLLEGGSDVNDYVLAGGPTPRTALFRAVHNGDAKMVRYLLSQGASIADIDATQNPNICPLLTIAIRRRHRSLVPLLLAHGANPNPPHVNPFMNLIPLMCAAGYAEDDADAAVVTTLLAHGANLHSETPYGNTTLHVAAMGGCVEYFPLLIAMGVDPQKKNLDLRCTYNYFVSTFNTELNLLMKDSNGNII